MREKINAAMKGAMKAGDKRRTSTLRLVNAAIKDRDIAARVDDSGQSTGRDKIDDTEILSLLQKMVKQRRESITTYQSAGRDDLVQQEAEEITIIEEFLPQQMSEDETKTAVETVIGEIGATGLKDMGRTMAALKERFTGRMDFSKASAIVKATLA
ncbi:MAG: GatB/YqeY domain-containing protein [Hyphomicrobiaceae bacterium]